jgi:WD40 repeat protein
MSYSPLSGHKYGVTCIRFSPQGTMLATSSVDGSTVLWSVRVGTGYCISSFDLYLCETWSLDSKRGT